MIISMFLVVFFLTLCALRSAGDVPVFACLCALVLLIFCYENVCAISLSPAVLVKSVNDDYLDDRLINKQFALEVAKNKPRISQTDVALFGSSAKAPEKTGNCNVAKASNNAAIQIGPKATVERVATTLIEEAANSMSLQSILELVMEAALVLLLYRNLRSTRIHNKKMLLVTIELNREIKLLSHDLGERLLISPVAKPEKQHRSTPAR